MVPGMQQWAFGSDQDRFGASRALVGPILGTARQRHSSSGWRMALPARSSPLSTTEQIRPRYLNWAPAPRATRRSWRRSIFWKTALCRGCGFRRVNSAINVNYSGFQTGRHRDSDQWRPFRFRGLEETGPGFIGATQEEY